VIGALHTLRVHFATGVRVLAPFVITFLIARFLYDLAYDLLQPVFMDWFGYRIPGLGVAVLVLGPVLVGTLALSLFGGRTILAVEAVVTRVPVIGPVFATVRQFVAALGGGAETGFNRVVEIEYPRAGVWSLGFMTDVLEHEDGSRMAVVYIPTSPTPNSGYLALVPVEDVRDTDLTVGQAFRAVVSAGVAAPDRINRRPAF